MDKILGFVWSKWSNIGGGLVLALYVTCDLLLPFSVKDESIAFRLPPNTEVYMLNMRGKEAAMSEEKSLDWRSFAEKVNLSG